MRLVYLGSPAEAVGPLRALVADGHDVSLVVTQPDRKRGRGGATQPTPVAAAAAELGLAVTHRVADVIASGADLGVVVAFGRLVKPDVLAAVPMVNIHFSLLPRWRGAAPVERAVLAGDDVTGVCLMQLEEGLDTGPVHLRREVAIGPDDTVAELRARLSELGTGLLVDALRSGLPDPEPQTGEPTYAAKLDPAELRLDWERSAVELHRVVRVGRAWTTFRGKRLIVHRTRLVEGGGEAGAAGQPGGVDGPFVTTGEGRLQLVEVQPEGRAAQPANAWLRGARPGRGERLGS